MRRLSVLFFLALASCSLFHRASSPRHPAQANPENVCAGINPVALDQFIWPQIRTALQAQSIVDVDRALCLIPRELIDQVGLMVSSVSLQRSSPEQPRVIVSSNYSNETQGERLFFSFSGPDLQGGNELEVMRFRPSLGPAHQVEMIEARLDGRLNLTENTPVRCQKCHGIEPQFLWSQRDFWPAAALGQSVQRTKEEWAHVNQSMAAQSRYRFLTRNGQVGGSLSTMNYYAAEVNNHRLLGKVQTSPNFQEYKFAILAGLLNCPQIDQFLPERIRAFHRNTSFAESSDWAKIGEIIDRATQSLISRADFSPAQMQPLAAPLEDLLGATPLAPRLPGLFKQLGLSPVSSSSHKPLSYAIYAADLMRIEMGKLLFGMLPGDNFPFVTVIDTTTASLRFLFEGRGVGIADWSYDDIQGTYHIDLENTAMYPFGVALLMIRADAELNIPETYALFGMKERGDDLSYPGTERRRGMCQKLQALSLARLSGLSTPVTYDLAREKPRAQINWQHHFSDLGKISDLPFDLPTNPKSARSCTQCHFNYAANYTGPVFTRTDLSHPLALMICANCHGDAGAHVAPQIPFHDQNALKRYIAENPGFSFLVQTRLSDDAKLSLSHMPPVLLLKAPQRKAILDYINKLDSSP